MSSRAWAWRPRRPRGLGGETLATLPVNPGQTLQVNVGGAGVNGPHCWPCPRGAGGFNGGGLGGEDIGNGGGGGGGSDIRGGAHGQRRCKAAAC